MELKYGATVDREILDFTWKRLINQTYKLLPMREEGLDWQKPLTTMMIELAGMQSLVASTAPAPLFFLLLCKMEGLFQLQEDSEFDVFRGTIFECIGIMSKLKGVIDERC